MTEGSPSHVCHQIKDDVSNAQACGLSVTQEEHHKQWTLDHNLVTPTDPFSE